MNNDPKKMQNFNRKDVRKPRQWSNPVVDTSIDVLSVSTTFVARGTSPHDFAVAVRMRLAMESSSHSRSDAVFRFHSLFLVHARVLHFVFDLANQNHLGRVYLEYMYNDQDLQLKD